MSVTSEQILESFKKVYPWIKTEEDMLSLWTNTDKKFIVVDFAGKDTSENKSILKEYYDGRYDRYAMWDENRRSYQCIVFDRNYPCADRTACRWWLHIMVCGEGTSEAELAGLAGEPFLRIGIWAKECPDNLRHYFDHVAIVDPPHTVLDVAKMFLDFLGSETVFHVDFDVFTIMFKKLKESRYYETEMEMPKNTQRSDNGEHTFVLAAIYYGVKGLDSSTLLKALHAAYSFPLKADSQMVFNGLPLIGRNVNPVKIAFLSLNPLPGMDQKAIRDFIWSNRPAGFVDSVVMNGHNRNKK